MGSEHPYCDRLQNLMITLYFVVWGVDSFILHYSTLVVGLNHLLLRMALSAIAMTMGGYLVGKSHKMIFDVHGEHSKFIDCGVYSLVRHPMYLGTLICCFALFLAIPSLLSLAVLVPFFVIYDKMATYEENELTNILGEEYVTYKKRVPKWFPRLISIILQWT